MDVVVAGGHGKIALLLEAYLTDAGHHVRALIRNPAHAGDVEASGAIAVVADLEALSSEQLATTIGTADAIVYAAGAGAGSGPERKWSMDYGGAVKLIEVSRRNAIDRYVMVSAVGADPDAPDDGGFGTYLRAKGKADADLAASGLSHTIVRPVGLTDDPGTGLISTDDERGSRQIPRADVAAALIGVLGRPETAGVTFVVRSGTTEIAAAISAL
jgi:uncharacterized protein YbjT (DUF2867 family)